MQSASIPVIITDVNGDGKNDCIAGKGHDYGLDWYEQSFSKQVISYGPFGEGKGTGIYFEVVDLRGTGRKDIIVAGKDGLFVFFNEG